MKHRDKRARTSPQASAPAETAGGGKSNAVLVAVARAIPLSEPTTGPPSDLPDECATPHSITTTAPCPEEAKAASPGRPAVYAPYEARSTFQGAWAGRVFKLGELRLLRGGGSHPSGDELRPGRNGDVPQLHCNGSPCHVVLRHGLGTQLERLRDREALPGLELQKVQTPDALRDAACRPALGRGR
jgi:hypothetical protein